MHEKKPNPSVTWNPSHTNPLLYFIGKRYRISVHTLYIHIHIEKYDKYINTYICITTLLNTISYHFTYTFIESVSLYLLERLKNHGAGCNNTWGRRNQWSIIVCEVSALSWVWWWTPAVPDVHKAELEASVEPKSSRLVWATKWKEGEENQHNPGESSEWKRSVISLTVQRRILRHGSAVSERQLPCKISQAMWEMKCAKWDGLFPCNVEGCQSWSTLPLSSQSLILEQYCTKSLH